MIEFQPIKLGDKELIESYTRCSAISNCDLSFANMYCWQTTFRSAWSIVDGYLVIRFNINGGDEVGYMQPLKCDGSPDFSHIIPHLAKDAHSMGQRLRIIGLTEAGRSTLVAAQGDNFAFYSDRDFEDYIFSRYDLENLTGKRYQPKRNHINQFEKLYNYEFQPLTNNYFDECRAICNVWRKQRGEETSTHSPESLAIERAFENFEELELQGGVILVDGKVVGFTYGSAINDTTFCTHIEKCDTSYTGIYSIINREFAHSLPTNFTQINREEDMGIEGLRRSKLSYYPISLQVKYTSIYLHRQESECKRLWKEVFGDDDSFIDHFLIKYFSMDNMLYITDTTNKYVSMVHIIPMRDFAYIYGVGTHPLCQGRGYATMLMEATMKKVRKDGYKAAILIPSEEWLIEYYAKFGFERGPHITFSTHDGFDFGSGDSNKDNSLICKFMELEVDNEIKLSPGKKIF